MVKQKQLIKPKICKNCQEEIPHDSKRKIYCSDKCMRTYNSWLHWTKIKNDPEYKEYRRDYMPKWIEKNRDKFNDAMRKVMKRKNDKAKIKKQLLKKQKEVK